jgi:hypothetical protein
VACRTRSAVAFVPERKQRPIGARHPRAAGLLGRLSVMAGSGPVPAMGPTSEGFVSTDRPVGAADNGQGLTGRRKQIIHLWWLRRPGLPPPRGSSPNGAPPGAEWAGEGRGDRIEPDGTMQRRMVDAALRNDGPPAGRPRRPGGPPSCRPVPGAAVYHVSVDEQAAQVGEYDLGRAAARPGHRRAGDGRGDISAPPHSGFARCAHCLRGSSCRS